MRTTLAILILASSFTYNAHAITWKRQVLSEGRSDGRTLLLVVEDAIDAKLLPRVILRKSFKRTELAKLERARQTAQLISAPHDLTPLTPTNNPLWPIDHQWTAQDEDAYADWLHNNAKEEMLIDSGVMVDCADYALVLRWIYAHDHHLPAGNNLVAGLGLFGSWQSTDVWDKLPTDADWKKDERFKRALKYLLDFSFTHSVFQDVYPVAITPDFVTPGTIYLTLDGETGHTRTLTNVGSSPDCSQSPECMIIIWGNEPADERGYITEFVPYWLAPQEGGLMRFRWPELTATGWQLRDPKQMPGYSEEQYTWDSGAYVVNVGSRLGLWTSPEDRMRVTGASANRLMIQRMSVSFIGYVMCSLVPCKPTDPMYNDYSTPVRDRALSLSIQNFQGLLKQVDPSSSELDDFKNNHQSKIYFGAQISAFDFLAGNQVTRLNSDPTVDFFARWGYPNAGFDERAKGLSDVAISVWFQRIDQVHQALELCFPNGGTTPTCNPADPNIKRLATDRLDQGLRELRKTFQAAYGQASINVQETMDDYLRDWEIGPDLCGPAKDSTCTFYDSLLGKVDHWAVMTSNPDSPMLKRLGF